MTVVPLRRPDNWVPLHAHLLAVQEERERFYAERDRRYTELAVEREKFEVERDRRYAEVTQEREKALKIKEVADLAALQLAREIQTYKDEKANNLRTQIESERGTYATKNDLSALNKELQATIAPLVDFASRSRGGTDKWAQIVLGVGLIATIITIILKF